MHPPTYRITTLGCRTNHAEARELESLLLTRGLRPAERAEAADLEVVHSCSVTRSAAAKSRAAIRRATRRQSALGPARLPNRTECSTHAIALLPLPTEAGLPGGTPAPPPPEVVITGCFAATDPADAAGLVGDADRVLPHETEAGSSLADRFAAHIDGWLARRSDPVVIRRRTADGSCPGIIPLPVVAPAARAGRHVRAELRIQDGCDAYCTFCIIPSIRRTLRSKSVADAVGEARRLVELGHREIVLSGVFIGAYGHETALRRRQRRRGSHPLADLVDTVARVPGLDRLRISSMEPGDVTPLLLDAMVANAPVVVPHLHLPLQSGSDRILRRMNRQYTVGAYLAMIDAVESALEGGDGMPPAITTDVICGFPGETEADFAETVTVARRVGFLHMHVFPYSPQAGTAAARWQDRAVDEATRRRRVRTLIDLETDPGDGLSLRFRRRLLGRTVRVILEQPARGEPGVMTGRCDHYALVHVPTGLPRGRLVEVAITGVDADRTDGAIHSADIRLPIAAQHRI